jgi:hypothetical protein
MLQAVCHCHYKLFQFKATSQCSVRRYSQRRTLTGLVKTQLDVDTKQTGTKARMSRIQKQRAFTELIRALRQQLAIISHSAIFGAVFRTIQKEPICGSK